MHVEWLGFAGTTIVILAYLPQLQHLIRERCSAGISINAYGLWAVAAVLLLAYAILVDDIVFIVLQIYHVIATSLVLTYAWRFRNSYCSTHGGHGH